MKSLLQQTFEIDIYDPHKKRFGSVSISYKTTDGKLIIYQISRSNNLIYTKHYIRIDTYNEMDLKYRLGSTIREYLYATDEKFEAAIKRIESKINLSISSN